MTPRRDTNGNDNAAVVDSNSDLQLAVKKEEVIEMRDGDTLQVQMSVDGAKILADLSPRITVTFFQVSKVINVPAKMIDPTSKERMIQRTLLDQVSGQIHPGQLVALMGPSGRNERITAVIGMDCVD